MVVVTLAQTGEFVTYLRITDRSGYTRLAMRKYEAAKTFRDFRILQRTLAEYGYSGPIHVYPEGHAFLQILG